MLSCDIMGESQRIGDSVERMGCSVYIMGESLIICVRLDESCGKFCASVRDCL